MAERDYSHRTLIDKLNIKEGARVLLLGVDDAELLAAIQARTADYSVRGRKKNCDVILFAADTVADLRKVESLRELLAPAGGLWIIYPKGRKDITEKHVREAGLATGMVDNKIIGFSATRTGLRFVIRKKDRE